MQKMIIAAMVLLVIQIGLALGLNMGSKGIGAGAPDALFLSLPPEEVHSLELTDGEGHTLVLQKDKNGWILPGHFSAPVADIKVQALLDKLAEMKQGFVVATSVEAAKRFKVDKDSFENHVVVRGADKLLADFYVGTSPAFRQAHARRGDSEDIVTIPLSSFELESTADKWLDTSLVTIKDEDLVGLDFTEFKLKKGKDGWQMEGLKDDEKIDQKKVADLATKARGLVVLDVLDPAKVSALFDQPVFRFTAIRKGGQEEEYLFAKSEGDFYVLKLSDRDLYFKVNTLPVEALQKMTREQLIEANQKEEKGVKLNKK